MLRRRHFRFVRLTTVALLLPLLASAAAAAGSAGQATTSFPAGASGPPDTPPCQPVTDFESGNFTDPTTIDNEFFPLVPGRQFVFEGGVGLLPHQVVFTVTDVTKVINGVTTVVLWDRDFRDLNQDQLVEEELAFFAQDDDGTVWNLGEYPEEYDESGNFAEAPSTWIAGLRDAQAGIHMQAKPRRGNGWYLQGFAPDIDFLDCAHVFKTGQTIDIDGTSYENVLVTNEVSPPPAGGGHQRKYHAPGVGIVQIGAVGDKEGETLVLVGDPVELDSVARAAANARALELDSRGYDFGDSGDYDQTQPAEQA